MDQMAQKHGRCADATSHRPCNVFVIGLNDYHEERLSRLAQQDGSYRFHNLVHMDELRGVGSLDVARLLDQARERLDNFSGPVDAIVTFIDFPAVEMAAILAREYGTRGPSLEGVLQCNHKYWSRLLQQPAIPEHVPAFAAFDPYDDKAIAELPLAYPYWIKPLNAYRSHLGFRINGPEDLGHAVSELREHLARLADPLDEIMSYARLPEEIRRLGSGVCLAEELIGGRQCTLEGYVQDGQPRVYGIVDSIREANRSSFSRYQYPSGLPQEVQERMKDIACRAITATELDCSTFNVELFYESSRDRIWLLEVNPRLSQSHCELFEKVDGRSHQQVAVDIALGRTPRMPYREGPYPVAAKFFLRAFGDAHVARTPGPAEIRRVQEAYPGTSVEVLVNDVSELSELAEQDSYSYELAWVWLGGENQKDLLQRFEGVKRMLHFELEHKQEAVAG